MTWNIIGTAKRPDGELWGVYRNGSFYKSRPTIEFCPVMGIEGSHISIEAVLYSFRLSDFLGIVIAKD